MRPLSALLAMLLAFSALLFPAAGRAAELSIVFSGNTWGYLKPCPT